MAPYQIFIQVPFFALLFARALALPIQAFEERQAAPIQQNLLDSRDAGFGETNTAPSEVETKERMIRNAMERAIETRLGKEVRTPVPHDGCRPPGKRNC